LAHHCAAISGANQESFMATVTRAGTPIPVAGRFPPPGDHLANFTLPGKDWGDAPLSKFTG